ncbi:hypothetical protein PTTG_29968, partial [Puccinia triticina 1-1 BBBD Race 1]
CYEEEEGVLLFYQCNVSDPVAVKAAAKRIQEEGRCPTIIFNNVGILHGKPILELEPKAAKVCFDRTNPINQVSG